MLGGTPKLPRSSQRSIGTVIERRRDGSALAVEPSIRRLVKVRTYRDPRPRKRQKTRMRVVGHPAAVRTCCRQLSDRPLGGARRWSYSRYKRRVIGRTVKTVTPPTSSLISSSQPTMSPRRSEEDQPPPDPGPAISSPTSKPSKNDWKTEEQVEYMLSHWSGYIAHQASKSLPRFWPRVCDGWYQRWPITPTPEMIEKHGSSTDAKLVLRKELNGVSTTEKKLIPYS